jgi:guanyl-specific ribonuclease Sa
VRLLRAALAALAFAAAAPAPARDAPSPSVPAVHLSRLPPEARRTIDLVRAGGPFPYRRDGVVFHNRERVLPPRPGGWYREFTVPSPGRRDRGPRRVVAGRDGALYYTGDHYRTFQRVEGVP